MLQLLSSLAVLTEEHLLAARVAPAPSRPTRRLEGVRFPGERVGRCQPAVARR